MSDKSKYDIQAAKTMYMEFKSLREIAEKLGINYSTLKYHKQEHKWEEERNLVRKDILRDLADNKKAVLVSLTSNSLDCVDRAVKDLKNRPKPPTIQEARMLTNIITEIDRIIRLDDGEPTDIISEHKPVTVIELREKLKKDPFFIEDASFREIDDEKTTDTNSTDTDASFQQTDSNNAEK